MGSAVKRWMSNILLIFMGTATAGLVVEIGLRIAGVSYPSFYRSDEHTGTSLRPGIEAWERNEGEAHVRINSDGLRDREHPKAKPANAFRIAVLGDSYTEARQVPMEDAFWAVLERDLKGCAGLAGRDVEVINFGVSNYGTAQELITLRRRVWDYFPDMVILAFLTGNDIHDNLRELSGDPKRPYFVYQDGALTLDASFRDSAIYRASETALARLGAWLTDYSRVLQLLYLGKNRLVRIVLYPRPAHDRHGEVGLQDSVYLEPTSSLWREAWRVTEGLIDLMRSEVRQKGADFLLVTLSNGIQVHPDPSVRRSYMDRLGAADLFYPDLRIAALGRREGFSVLTLAPEFQAYAEKHQAFLHGFGNNPGAGHWNRDGHRLAGKAISEKVCEQTSRDNVE
ncbi:MAG TPA: SGNH/GDSL hydrolase family protein [Candidatus Binatia bacterium]